MDAEKSLIQGNLEESLDQLQQKVRQDPANPKLRTFLFQLLSVLGQWDRAKTQLNVAGEMDARNIPMMQTYREALRCEVLRTEVFAGKRTPLVFGDPEEWIAQLMEALRLSSTGAAAAAQALRDRAFEAAPATSGKITTTKGGEERFEWIADADPRLGPMLEAVILGRYYWVPFGRIHQVHVEEPEDLRDLVWTPAHFTWANGGQTVGLIPTRYPGSESHEDNRIRLARLTDWVEQEGGLFTGLGQRMLATDAGEHPLLDVRLIALDTVDQVLEEPGEEAPPEAAHG